MAIAATPILTVSRAIICQQVHRTRQFASTLASASHVIHRRRKWTPCSAYNESDRDKQPLKSNDRQRPNRDSAASTEQEITDDWPESSQSPRPRVGVSIDPDRLPSFDVQLVLLLGVPIAFLLVPWIIEHPLAALLPAALALVPPTSLFLQPVLRNAVLVLMQALYSSVGANENYSPGGEPPKAEEHWSSRNASQRTTGVTEVLLLPEPAEREGRQSRSSASRAADSHTRRIVPPARAAKTSSSSSSSPRQNVSPGQQTGRFKRGSTSQTPTNPTADSQSSGRPRRHVTLAEVRAAAAKSEGAGRTNFRSLGRSDRTLRSEEDRIVRPSSDWGVGVDVRYRPVLPWWQRFASSIAPFFRDLFGLDDR